MRIELDVAPELSARNLKLSAESDVLDSSLLRGHPNINVLDLKLLALCCLGFT